MSGKWLLYGALLVSVASLFLGCASAAANERRDPLNSYDPDRADVSVSNPQIGAVYQQMGLAASGAPISFVARAGSFATQTPDTSVLLVGLSIPNRGLTFRHSGTGSGSGNAASYVVTLTLDGAAIPAQQVRDSELVRVPTAREISRSDESIIYRHVFRVPPGDYALTSEVLDVTGAHQSMRRVELRVPRFTRPAVSTPVPVYESKPRLDLHASPDLVVAPRGSYVFGVDDSATVYLESYGSGSAVELKLSTVADSVLWSGSADLARSHTGVFGSGVVRVPLGNADMGVLILRAVRAGQSDTTHASLLLGFSPDLPVVSFGQMLAYLRFFARPGEIKALRSAPANARSTAWAAFLRATDPDPSTSANEALDDYFIRIRDANEAFRGDARGGWLSDRGMVYVGLGQPTSASEQYGYLYMPGDVSTRSGARTRLLVWDYPDLHTRIVFYDQLDSGAWRLTQQSAAIFPSLLFRRPRR